MAGLTKIQKFEKEIDILRRHNEMQHKSLEALDRKLKDAHARLDHERAAFAFVAEKLARAEYTIKLLKG